MADAFAPLTPFQAQVLLHKHLTGDYPRRPWKTMEALIDHGMVHPHHGALPLTPKGYDYCVAHHMGIRILCSCHPGL